MKIIYSTLILFGLFSCRPNDVKSACESDDVVEELPWLMEEVEKAAGSGPALIIVGRYRFEGDTYLVVTNPISSAMSRAIFNCQGVQIDKLRIGMEEFYTQAEIQKAYTVELK